LGAEISAVTSEAIGAVSKIGIFFVIAESDDLLFGSTEIEQAARNTLCSEKKKLYTKS
jgi:hypothetical protein